MATFTLAKPLMRHHHEDPHLKGMVEVFGFLLEASLRIDTLVLSIRPSAQIWDMRLSAAEGDIQLRQDGEEFWAEWRLGNTTFDITAVIEQAPAPEGVKEWDGRYMTVHLIPRKYAA